MEEMQGSTINMAQDQKVEAHMIQHFQALNSKRVVEEGVVVVFMIARVEKEDLVDHPFVYLLRRLRLMDQF